MKNQMKNNQLNVRGTTRKMDSLGRLVIPSEHRKQLGINEDDMLEIILVEGGVFIKKQDDVCVFCGKHTVLKFKERTICSACAREICKDIKSVEGGE